jgi:hypothetical protein
MKFTEKTRILVMERAKDRCEMCGAPVEYPQLHHRRPRGMGGTRNPASRSPANALALHLACHAWIESNRAEAIERGYLVRQSESSCDVPVLTADGWVLLRDDGSVLRLGEARVQEGKPDPRSFLPQGD